MPASISSKTSVSPPATTASASATRESSPPDAVSATGPKGMPGLGRIRKTASSRPLGPGSRSFSSTRNSPSPMPTPSRFSATATANGSAAAVRAAWSAAITSSKLLLGAGELGRGGRERVEAAVERVEIGGGALAALEQLLQRLRVEAAAQLGDQVEPRLDRPPGAPDRPRARRRTGAGRFRPRSGARSARGARPRRLRARGRAGSAAPARARPLPRATPPRRRPRVRRLPSPERRPRRDRLRGACARARPAATPPRLPAALRCARRGRAAPRCARPRHPHRARSPRGAGARP